VTEQQLDPFVDRLEKAIMAAVNLLPLKGAWRKLARILAKSKVNGCGLSVLNRDINIG
jgi:hypothetical protein